MELSIQTALLHVTDLKRSIEFYQDVFDLPLTSQQEEVAVLMVSETSRRQVLLLPRATRQLASFGAAQHRAAHAVIRDRCTQRARYY